MKNKIRILFFNRDAAGVNYFRTQTPAMELERNHDDEFYVELTNNLDFTPENTQSTIEYLKSFDIIHYHRAILPDINAQLQLANELKSAGVTLIMDIDDYWELDKTHPFYLMSKERRMDLDIRNNLKIADYVTTTTDIFASEIKKITGKDNVQVFYNSIDPTWMKQFKDNRKPDPNGLVRITYMAGSSHRNDMQQLRGVVNRLNADPQTTGKFKMIIAGWDTEGATTDVKFNDEFAKDMQKRGLWTRKVVKSVNQSKGDVDKILNIPDDLKDKYRNKVFTHNQRSIYSEESVYLEYEKILTDNHRIIHDDEYMKWLNKFERGVYHDEKHFARRWTQKANIYAKVLDETDISIAPLADNMFNRMKSNLKQAECWSRKLAIVCSDIPPYNVHGVNEHNCMLVPIKKNSDKYWYKALKKLILDKDLRERLGNQLYEDFKEEYNLANVTAKRAEFYKSLIKESVEA